MTSPPGTPLTLHVTALFVLPVTVTVGVNCCVPPAGTVALVGLMLIVTAGAVSVTSVLAVLVVSACETAVTATVVVVGKTVGAV